MTDSEQNTPTPPPGEPSPVPEPSDTSTSTGLPPESLHPLDASIQVAAPEPPVPFAKFPEDLRVPWTWTDVVIFLVLAIGIQLLLDPVLLNVAIGLHLVKAEPQALMKFATTNAGYVTLRQLLFWVLALSYLFVVLHERSPQPFFRMMGWRPLQLAGMSRRMTHGLLALAGVPLAYLVSLLSSLAQPEKPLPIEMFFQDARSVLMLSAMGILVAPLVEEMVFRGFLYPVVARSMGVPGGVIVTGVLFGLMHAQQLAGGKAQIALLILVGILFTYVRARTRSVTASFLLHLGYNTFLFLGFFLVTDFLRHIPAK